MAFEYYTKTLAKELYQKSLIPESEARLDTTIKYYSEQEIWYIMESLVSLTRTFKQCGYCHGDIQPINIVIEENGFIKLFDNSLINYGKNGYLKMVYSSTYTAALSPQLLDALKTRELKPIHDPVKSDIFAIGITTLCAATNLEVDDFYDWRNKEIRYNRIKDAFIAMRNYRFSEQLINKIDCCLEAQEERRAENEDLYRFLTDHQIHSPNFMKFENSGNIY